MRILTALLLLVPLYAQTNITPMESATNLPAQRLGADDLIGVSVYGAPELTRTLRLGSDGLLHLPLLKSPVKAGGLLPSELEAALTDAILKEQLLVSPIVTVQVVEYHHPIVVVGAVHKPLTFQAYGKVTVLDAIAKAEGLSIEAGTEVIVSRSAPGDKALTQRIAIRQLMDSADDPAVNLLLQGGEMIRVPEAGRIFVVGNVHKPGAFVLKDSEESTVLKMVAQAEGLMPFAARQAFIYRREADSPEKREIPVELSRIVDRKVPDVPLQPNDVLYIPDNKGQRLTMGALERLLGFSSATASGLLIWRH